MKKSQLISFGGFLLSFSAFVIIALIAIIFAQGRTLNEDGSISQTSIINVNTVPGNVEVFVDNNKVTLNDNKVEWVQPGLRRVKIVKAGYKDWEKEIRVDAGVVKNIYAQLYPDNLNFSKLSTTNIHKVFFSDNSEFAYFTVIDNVTPSQNGLWRLKLSRNFLDLGNNAPILISNLNGYLSLLQNNEYTLSISSDNNKILFKMPSQSILQIIEVNRQNQETNVTSLLGYYPDNISWFRGSDSIAVEKNNLLFEYEFSSAQKSLVDFSFEQKLIYSVNSNHIIYLNTQDKKIYTYSNKFSTPLVSELIPEDLSQLSGFQSLMGSKDIIVLKFPTSFLYLNLDKKYKEEVTNISTVKKFSNNGRVLVFERESKLFTYTLENTPDNLSFTSEQNELNIDPTLVSSMYISSNSMNILFQLNPISASEGVSASNPILVSFDADGGNKTEILDDARIGLNSNFAISIDSTNMYLLLTEQVQETSFESSLYELDLVTN